MMSPLPLRFRLMDVYAGERTLSSWSLQALSKLALLRQVQLNLKPLQTQVLLRSVPASTNTFVFTDRQTATLERSWSLSTKRALKTSSRTGLMSRAGLYKMKTTRLSLILTLILTLVESEQEVSALLLPVHPGRLIHPVLTTSQHQWIYPANLLQARARKRRSYHLYLTKPLRQALRQVLLDLALFQMGLNFMTQ